MLQVPLTFHNFLPMQEVSESRIESQVNEIPQGRVSCPRTCVNSYNHCQTETSSVQDIY